MFEHHNVKYQVHIIELSDIVIVSVFGNRLSLLSIKLRKLFFFFYEKLHFNNEQ